MADAQLIIAAPPRLVEAMLANAEELTREQPQLSVARVEADEVRGAPEFLDAAMNIIGHIADVGGFVAFVSMGVQAWRSRDADARLSDVTITVVSHSGDVRQIQLPARASEDELRELLERELPPAAGIGPAASQSPT